MHYAPSIQTGRAPGERRDESLVKRERREADSGGEEHVSHGTTATVHCLTAVSSMCARSVLAATGGRHARIAHGKVKKL